MRQSPSAVATPRDRVIRSHPMRRASIVALLIAAGCGGGGGSGLADAGPGPGGVDAQERYPVGRACVTAADAGTTVTVVATPALECPSRACMSVAGGNRARCTSACDRDEDCVAAPEALDCAGGFVCAAVVELGPFCCVPLCVCADDVPSPPPLPAACEPANPQNQCCNLEGRPACF